MTVSSMVSRVSYVGDGVTKSFAVAFPFFSEGELTVIERVVATGAESVKTLGTDYSVSGGGGATGTVTMIVAPAATAELHIVRNSVRTQGVDLRPHDVFGAETLEEALDRLVLQVQDLARDVARALKATRTDDPAVATELPAIPSRKGKYAFFDSTTGAVTAVGATFTADSSVLVFVGPAAPAHLQGRIWVDSATADTLITKQSDGAAWREIFRVTISSGVVQFNDLATVAQVLAGTNAATSVTPDALAATWEEGVAVASASALALPAGGGTFAHVTGTTTIDTIDTTGLKAGWPLMLVFDGALTLVNSANLILQGTNIITAAGAVAFLRYEGGTVWRLVNYHEATGSTAEAAWPRGTIGGFVLANNGADAANDIDVGVGSCRSDDDAENIKLAAAITKRLDAPFAAGTNQGGLDTGAEAVSTWYHLWAIKNPATGAVDALFSLSATSPTMPAGYTKKRRLGAVRNDAASAILAFDQYGDEFWLDTPILDVNAANPGTAAVTRALTTPGGVKCQAVLNAGVSQNSSAGVALYLSSLDAADLAASLTVAPLGTVATASGSVDNVHEGGQARVWTDTSSQIRSRVNASGANTNVRIATLGWRDQRGKDA